MDTFSRKTTIKVKRVVCLLQQCVCNDQLQEARLSVESDKATGDTSIFLEVTWACIDTDQEIDQNRPGKMGK